VLWKGKPAIFFDWIWGDSPMIRAYYPFDATSVGIESRADYASYVKFWFYI